MRRKHRFKIPTHKFKAILDGTLTFILRQKSYLFASKDKIVIQEWMGPAIVYTGSYGTSRLPSYTGAYCIVEIIYIQYSGMTVRELKTRRELTKGSCVLGIKVLPNENHSLKRTLPDYIQKCFLSEDFSMPEDLYFSGTFEK